MIALPASAQMREIGQGELRDLVGSGNAMGLSQALALVSERLDGKFVDVRAFQDDAVYYRILVKRPDGQLVAAIVDARVGRLISGRSSTAQEVMAAAKGNGRSGENRRSGGNSGNRGNGNNGQGNAGGNGNGGGNSGGGGGGNSGGGGNGGGKQ